MNQPNSIQTRGGKIMTVKLTPYITLEGRTKEAIEFYQQTIGAEVLFIATYGDMPNMPSTFRDEMKHLVAHAKLKVGESELMFSDSPGGEAPENGKRVTICMTTNDVDHSKRIFEALRQDGQVNIPFQEEPFSPGFGDVTDKFGVTFQIYTEIQQ
jgi:PhnB protein